MYKNVHHHHHFYSYMVKLMRCNQISAIKDKPTRYSIKTSSFRFVQFFKKRQKLIAISGDELESFPKARDIFLKTRVIVERYFACQLEPIVEKWSLKTFDKVVKLVIETPFRLNSLTEDLPVFRKKKLIGLKNNIQITKHLILAVLLVMLFLSPKILCDADTIKTRPYIG